MTRTRHLTIGEVRSIRFERAALYAVLGVALVAALVSFVALRWAALQIGTPEALSWIFPITVDGIAGVASAATIALHNQPFRIRAYVWLAFGVFLGISVYVNALHAIDVAPSLTLSRAAIAGLAAIPPVSFAIGLHLYIVLLRRGVASKMRSEVEVTSGAPARPAPRHQAAPAPKSAPRTAAPARARMADQGAAYDTYRAALASGHEMTGAEIADALGCTTGNARKVRKQWRDRAAAEGLQPPTQERRLTVAGGV